MGTAPPQHGAGQTLSAAPRIPIVTDVAEDANVARMLLGDEFEFMRSLTDPVRVVADFESYKHDIIVLVFNGREKAVLRNIGFDEGNPAPSDIFLFT